MKFAILVLRLLLSGIVVQFFTYVALRMGVPMNTALYFAITSYILASAILVLNYYPNLKKK